MTGSREAVDASSAAVLQSASAHGGARSFGRATGLLMKAFRKIEQRSRFSLAVVSALLVLLVCAADVATGSEASVSIFYVLPVSIASWFVSRRAGLLVSTACTVAWYVADLPNASTFSTPFVPIWNALTMFAFFAAAAVTLSALHSAWEHENSLARGIQEGFLPKTMPTIPGLTITSAWLPARVVSGDYFDVVQLDEARVGLCIADVSGHGMHAALLMSNFQAAFRLHAPHILSPGDLCARLNAFVLRNTHAEHFITFFYGVLDTVTNEIHYVNAGHNRPVLMHDSGMRELADGGFPLGMFADSEYDEGRADMLPGDLLVLYTDGITEATDGTEEMFGAERLTAILAETRPGGARAVRDAVIDAVTAFGKNRFEDDVTLLVVSRS